MSNIKSTRSLHIQNDQTDDAGVYQRNSGADLFMEAPGGIQEFTNFNDKVSSSNDGEAPANAFTKSPYYDSVESMFGSTGLVPTDKNRNFGGGHGEGALGQTLDNEEFSEAIRTWTQITEGSGKYGPYSTFVDSASLITRTERSGAIPSDIKILDDIAVVSYRNHSQESYLANVAVGDGFVVIKVVYGLGGLTDVQEVEIVRGVSFADLGTSSVSQQQFLGRGHSGIYANPSNAGLEAGYNICFEGAVASALGLGPTIINESAACSAYAGDIWTWNLSPSEPGWTITSPGQCASNHCGSMPPAYDGTSDEEQGIGSCGVPATVKPLCYTEETHGTSGIKYGNRARWNQKANNIRVSHRDPTDDAPPAELAKVVTDVLYYNRSASKKGYIVKEIQGLNLDIGAGRRTPPGDHKPLEDWPPGTVIMGIVQPTMATLFTLCARTDAELIWMDGEANAVGGAAHFYKVPVQTTSDSFFYKKGRANRCGRVDIYERRKGSITAVSGNKITVTGPTGDGTYDTELLQDGDKIKIVSVLNDTPKDHIHPMNGVKYVKRTAIDTEYYIYDDENLTEETDTSGIRDVSSALWAHYGATQGSNGSWRFKETLFSPNGPNGNGNNSKAQYIISGESPKLAEIAGGHSAQNYNGMELLPEAYRFGQAVDIIKQPNTDYYWLAISEMGNDYSTQHGIDYHGVYGWAQRPISSTLGGRTSSKAKSYNAHPWGKGKYKDGPLPEYGYKFSPPVHEPYGRVWLYKISMSSSAISAVNTPEEINASTTNPYINSPPFLDGDLDFEAFTDYRNLYWHRAMVSNFIAEGAIGPLFNHGPELVKRYPITSRSRVTRKTKPPISSGSMQDGTFYYNRGKSSPFSIDGIPVTVIDSQIKAEEFVPGYYGQRRVASDDFFLSKIAPYYRANNSQYGGYPHPIKKSAPGEDQPSTIGYHWLSTGYKFADGFGFNLCMKVDDVANGSKPIIAISNTAFPYLSTVSKSTDSQLSELQKKVDKLERGGYKDPHTQDFIDRHTKTNQFISEFCAGGEGDKLGNRFRRGSILIYNGNQSINLQTLDHTVRVNENLATLAYFPHYTDGNAMQESRVFTDWYGKPPTMMFRNGSLLVGTDEGRIKVFKEGSLLTSSYRKSEQHENVGLRRYKLLLSRFVTVGGEDYILAEGASKAGELIQSAGYQHFSDYDKQNNDEWVLGNEDVLVGSPGVGNTYKYAIEGWVWKREDLSTESVYYPLPARPINAYTSQPEGVETYSYLDYSVSHVNAAPDILPGLIYSMPPESEDIDIPGFNSEDQLSAKVEDRDWDNILLREPFGYTFRCDKNFLIAHGSSYTNAFDIKGDNIAHRLYVYEFNKNNYLDLAQKITPAIFASDYTELKYSSNEGDPSYYALFNEGAINFSESIDHSRTIGYLMTNMYDIMAGKIVLMTPLGYAVFGDSGFSTDYEFDPDERSITADSYFTFIEKFGSKNPYNLNNMYSYSGGAGMEYPAEIFDINDEHNGLCSFYNIENTSSQDDSIRLLKGARFIIDVAENTTTGQHDNVSSVLPVLAFYNDDPRKTITQKGHFKTTISKSGRRGRKIGKLLYGAGKTPGSVLGPNVPLYVDGLQDAASLVKYPLYTSASRGWQGVVDITGPELTALIKAKSFIKDSSDNRSILNNDGKGNLGSYSFIFDDANKPSFDASVDIESTLIAGLVSHDLPLRRNSTSARGASSAVATCNDDGSFIVEWGTPFAGQGGYITELWNVTDDVLVKTSGTRGPCNVRSCCGGIQPSTTNQHFYGNSWKITDCKIYMVKLWFYDGPIASCSGDLIAYVETNNFNCCDLPDKHEKLSSTAYRTKFEETYPSSYQRREDLNYIPYSKPFNVAKNIHSYVNKAMISQVLLVYQDYSLKELRKKFKCSFYQENTSSISEKADGITRIAKSDTSSFFDEEGTILSGTDSKSIQVVNFYGVDEVTSTIATHLSKSFSASDIQRPEFLGLSILSAPISTGNFDMVLSGYIPASGSIPAHIAGIANHSEGMPLRLGPLDSREYLGVSIPTPFGFQRGGLSLFTPTAFGKGLTSSMPIQFPGGEGVNKNLSLIIGLPHSSGGMRLAMGQPALDSGNMSVAMPEVHGSYNSIPYVQGNLYLNSTYIDNDNLPLTMGRYTASGTMPLYIGAPDPASGVMNLTINTEPLNSGASLYYNGYGESSSGTNLYIGEQASDASVPLSLMQPHRLPFVDPQSPPTYEGNDTMQIPNLYVSGAAIPTANSLDNNYHHQKQMVRENSQFDYSSNAEAIISYSNSNSLSRNTLTGSTVDYGVRRISKVGKTLEDYNGWGTVDFYSNDLSKQSIDSNGQYLAVGTNTSNVNETAPLHIFDIVDENSVDLSYTYNRFREDLIDLGTIPNTGDEPRISYKDVKVSSGGRIAISARVYINADIYDMVFILERATINEIVTVPNLLASSVSGDFDWCGTGRFTTTVRSSEGWKITSAFTSESWRSSSSSSDVLNRTMGTSLSWKGEDLYYDKQSVMFGNVYARYESDSYVTENKVFGFNNTGDAVGYNRNMNNIPAGTKVGFGTKIQLAGDLAFVGAPLLDPYIANNNLSAINAASPDGAVYVFKYDSGWSYVDAIYGGGIVSSAISGVDTSAYDAKLFGYDLDYDSKSGYLVVGEPMSNTVYQFNINAAGTPLLLNSYSDTDSKFGTFVNSVSAGLITNTKSKIQDMVYSQDFEYSTEEIESEVRQYVPGDYIINSISHEIVSVRKASLAGKERLLVVRDFEVNYGAGSVKEIQKISLLGLRDINGSLYISGPPPVADSINLSVPSPLGGATGDLGITFGSYATGVMVPLHLEVPSASSGTTPLHVRGPVNIKVPLHMNAEYKEVSLGSSLSTSGPIKPDGIYSDLSVEGKTVRDLSSSVFVLGGRGAGGGMSQGGTTMSIAQVDLYPVSGQQDILITGLGNGISGNIGSFPSLYLGGGNFGPADGVASVVMKSPLSADVSASTELVIITDPASGSFETIATLMVPNTQTVDVNGKIFRTSESLYMHSTAPSSGNMNLVVYRKGVGGGEELSADTSLMLTSITSASDINVYMSGGYMSTNTASLTIPEVYTLPSGKLDLFMRGYSE